MSRRYKRMTYEDRKKIEFLYKNKTPISDIANAIGVARMTIHRELKRGTDENGDYSAEAAQMKIFV